MLSTTMFLVMVSETASVCTSLIINWSPLWDVWHGRSMSPRRRTSTGSVRYLSISLCTIANSSIDIPVHTFDWTDLLITRPEVFVFDIEPRDAYKAHKTQSMFEEAVIESPDLEV
jgi:hypothetical protein